MSTLGPMGALGGHLVVCPHNPCWKWPRSDTEFAASGILRISNPKSQLRRSRDGQSVARRKCMAGQAKVLDADGNLKTTDSDDGASRDSKSSAFESGGNGNATMNNSGNSAAGSKQDAESIPLLKPSPRPVAPPVRPKPIIQQPPARPQPVIAQPQNGPLRNPQATPGVQRLDRTFENAERISARPAMARQQSFQQPGFQTKWRKGDSATPMNRGNGAVGNRPPEARASQAAPTASFGNSGAPMPNATTQAGRPVTPPMSRLTGPSAQPAQNMSPPPATSVRPSATQVSNVPISSVPSEPKVSGASAPFVTPDSASKLPSASGESKVSVPFVSPATTPSSRLPPSSSAPIRSAAPPIRPPVRPAPPPVRSAPTMPVPPISRAPPGRAAGPRLIDTGRRPQPAFERSEGASQIEMGRQSIVEEKREAEGRARPVEDATTDEQPLMMDRIANVRLPKNGQATTYADAGTNVPGTFRAPQVPNAPPQQARSPRLNSPPLVRPRPIPRQQQQQQPEMAAKPILSPKPVPEVEETIEPVLVPEVDRPSPKGRPGKVVKDKYKQRYKKDEEDGGGAATLRRNRKYLRAKRKAMRAAARAAAAPVKVEILELGKEGMSVGTLAQNLVVTKEEIVNFLASKGIPAGINQTLDEECVKIVCNQYDVEVLEAIPMKVEELAKKEQEFIDEEDLDSLEPRPPVIAVMGHVDHGKTSLLDYIRKTRVAAKEAGGITQGIGAYQVPVSLEDETEMCVFLDTPGHEAFSSMRARGARVTDIAVIVVAADDGPRPQTSEAIAHARAAKVPIVVAINKIDKPGVSVDRVKEELSKEGLVPPEWGGEDQMVPVSAITGEGIDVLLETIMLVAEIQELRANPNRTAKGTVIEATLRKTKGTVATLLVQNGTLKKGDVVLSGESYGRIRAMYNDQGALVDEAGPSVPVQVIGLSTVPIPGDTFEVRESIDDAREAAAENSERLKEARLAAQASESKVTLAALANAVASGEEIGVEARQLNVVLKVDVQGSVEAIREALQVLPQDTVNLRFLLQATGDIATSDVDLALASGAIIVGFNVRVAPGVKTDRVEVRLYKVIYDLVEDMRQAMEGLLKPKEEEVPIGMAEVRAVFNSGSFKVAGCLVTEGKLVKGCGVHIERKGKRLYTGTLDSLRRVKEMAKQVESGLECGVGVSGFDDWDEECTIQAFNKVEKKRTLEDASATVAATLAAGGEMLYEKNTETEEASEPKPDNNTNKSKIKGRRRRRR